MSNESITPIGDRVRKLELMLSTLKDNKSSVEGMLAIVKDSKPQRWPVVHPAIVDCTVELDHKMYESLLTCHLTVLDFDIKALESKLTTIYAALNDCLGE